MLPMNDATFEARLRELRDAAYREDYEAALYELCMACTVEQCGVLRQTVSDGKLWRGKPWRNPTDYDRSDLSWEQKVRRALAELAVKDGDSPDYRDDLCSLAWLYHNLRLRGLDAERELLEVSGRASPQVAPLIRGFVSRRPADRSMEAFLLTVEHAPDGPRAILSAR